MLSVSRVSSVSFSAACFSGNVMCQSSETTHTNPYLCPLLFDAPLELISYRQIWLLPHCGVFKQHNEKMFHGVRHIYFICYLYVCQDGTESSVLTSSLWDMFSLWGAVFICLCTLQKCVKRGCGCGVLVWFLQ